ncbi:uncharacterized protein LOC141641449 [Silene latifolia]|uniref:uncharacterized protein LOC141641449 n=1 Tax=Silene latifolia TaxID=37657 RepID=UPI003D76E0B7
MDAGCQIQRNACRREEAGTPATTRCGNSARYGNHTVAEERPDSGVGERQQGRLIYISSLTSRWASPEQQLTGREAYIEQNYQELRNLLRRVPGMPPPMEMATPDSYADSPFTDAIAAVALPKGFSVPTMTLFDGTTDPCDHISQYKQKMMQFASSRRTPKQPSDLYRIVQVIGESIKDYVTRFNTEKVAIRGCDTSTTINAIRQGLDKDSDLYKELTMNSCERFEEVQQRATAALRLEEDILSRKGIVTFDRTSRKTPTEKKDERAKPYSRPNISKVAEKSQQVEDSQYPPRLAEYGFNKGMEGLLKALKELGDQVRWPKPPTQDRPNDDRDRSKRCEWHQDIGHRTEDCFRLRKEVKFQVRKGNLDHLLPRGGKKDRRETANQVLPSAPPIFTKIINVITCGSELSGLTYSAAKRRATEGKGDHPETSCRVSQSDLPMVTFDETDAGNEAEQHHSALTITYRNCTVQKVLVDTGSSVNLIMFETLKVMGFDKENLIKKSVPLVGFSCETAHSVGEITIPTYIEGVNKLVRYLVIEGPPTYNVILRRPWLHQMKAIPSTYYQCLKFPTPWGVVKDRGTSEEYKEPPSEELDQVHLDEANPDRAVLIGATCTGELRDQLI